MLTRPPRRAQPNIAGLVLAGSADFKTELGQSDMFDQRLVPKIVKVVDISYGGEAGFNQAIELAGEALNNVKFVQEKKLIQAYFDLISADTGRYCFSVNDTLKALEMGAVETLIVWEGLETVRYHLRNPQSGDEKVIFLNVNQEGEQFKDPATGEEFEVLDKQLLMEWFADNYKKFGANLEFVTNKSPEGSQFVKGFGGIGGILRYQVNFTALDEDMEDDMYLSDSD